MSSVTGEQSAGSIMDIALCLTHRFNKATGILITRGDVCMIDTATTPDSFKQTPASASLSTLWMVALETVAVADAKDRISGCFAGPVVVNLTGNFELYEMAKNDTANAGKVMAYVTLTVGGAYAQAEVQAVRDDWKSRIGLFWGHAHEFRQGVYSAHTSGQFNNLGVIWLSGGSGR
jgi:hypothetical protein